MGKHIYSVHATLVITIHKYYIFLTERGQAFFPTHFSQLIRNVHSDADFGDSNITIMFTRDADYGYNTFLMFIADADL